MSGFRNAPSITEFRVGMRVEASSGEMWQVVHIAECGDVILVLGDNEDVTWCHKDACHEWRLDLDSIWVGRKYQANGEYPDLKRCAEVRAIEPSGWIVYHVAYTICECQADAFRRHYEPLPLPTPEPPVKTDALEEMLIEDNKKLRAAGCLLAERALYVVGHYDGLHRLADACAAWATAISTEGGRSSIITKLVPERTTP